MNTKATVNLLRAASILSLLYCMGHMSGLPWTPGESSAAAGVVDSMRSVQFEAIGEQRTYWDFYFGFGLIIGLDLLVQSGVLWWLSTLARREARALMPVLGVMLAGVVGNMYLSQRYFFVIPAGFGLAIALLLGASMWSTRRGEMAVGVQQLA
jgi:hypothetical protein